jgi:hypothetical protein
MCFDPVLGCIESASASGADAGSADAGALDAAATEALCTQTGGTVVDMYCSPGPPFAAHTCATKDNGGICDPGPPLTEECICTRALGLDQCFDPVRGCVPDHT